MQHPHNDKFYNYDLIKESLTGYGRMIYYRADDKDEDGNPDPTQISGRKNWLMRITEGEFW